MDDKKLDFLDILSIMSFCIGLQNLDLNVAQEDIDNQTQELDKKLHESIEDIHRHLAVQDEKLNVILRILKENGGII